MKTIILASIALLSVSGMAFAGSDNFGSSYIPGSDSYPGAVHHAMASHAGHALDMKSTGTVAGESTDGNSAFDMPAPGYGQGIWGR